jgi:hypothetical protein
MITDRELAVSSLKKLGYGYREAGNSLTITSGPMSNALLNLESGEVTGDTDYGHSREGLQALNQTYGEQKYVQECQRQGITIESRSVDQQGNVILMCAMM